MRRLLISVSVGLIASLIFFGKAYGNGLDFEWPYLGAYFLRTGQPVYTEPAAYPLGWPLYYPLPALLLILPLTWFPVMVAGVLFTGFSSSLLVWGLTQHGYQRLWVLASAPYWMAIMYGQWSPLLLAAALLPNLLPLALCKPNVGLPLLLAFCSRRTVLVSMFVLLISCAVYPTWPFDWLHNLNEHQNVVPLLTLPGVFLLLALLRWRDPHARLLVVLAAMPQRLYDPLALWLIPRTAREGMILTILSWLAYLPRLLRAGGFDAPSPLEVWLPYTITGLLYLPALAMILSTRQSRSLEATSHGIPVFANHRS